MHTETGENLSVDEGNRFFNVIDPGRRVVWCRQQEPLYIELRKHLATDLDLPRLDERDNGALRHGHTREEPMRGLLAALRSSALPACVARP